MEKGSGRRCRVSGLRFATIVAALLTIGTSLLVSLAYLPSSSAAADVKIALIVPLSGRYARQGQLKKMGAEMAIDEINASGGVKALGGANIALVTADAGDTIEKAVSVAQRVLTREKVVAGIGAWLSSFTLGITEVSERLHIPWVTLSYADPITERGYRYVFQSSPVASIQATRALDLVVDLAKANGRTLKTAALIGDTTATSVAFLRPLKEKLLPAKGISVLVDESWSPPLADATPIAQKLRSAKPDIVFYGGINFPDTALFLQKVKEFGLAMPIVGVGAQMVSPEFLDVVGKDLVNNVMAAVASHPIRGQEALIEKFKKRTGEKFMTQDPLSTYANVWIIKEALERARSADPTAVRDALAALDLTSGPAASSLAPGRIRFDERGRRVDATPIIAQWQGGEPVTVFPAELATHKPAWPWH
jgi:branched-chain amino acid transport system substrate-binding protein